MAVITYEMLKANPEFDNFPILTLDQRWYQLVTEEMKTDEIRYWEKRVNVLLKKQGRINDNLKDVKGLKKKLFKSVLNTMNNDESDRKKKKIMETNQKLINEANEKLDVLQNASDKVPEKLQQANLHLLAETVNMCYSRIEDNEKDIEALEEWIEKVRIRLKKNLLIQKDKQEVNEQMYKYMYSIVGKRAMSFLDKIRDGIID